MANALKDLFDDIAESIRAKTGKPDKMSPYDFPAQIKKISVGSGVGEGCVSITFVYGNESWTRPVYIGDDCPDPVAQGHIETPTKESTVDTVFTYSGWSLTNGGSADTNALANVTEDITVYAAYQQSVRKYTITYYDDDGTTVLSTEQVAYGTMPNYTPVRDGVILKEWTPTLVKVTGDASYTASWTDVLANGTCGTNITWSLNNDYVLTIAGTGDMADYEYRDNYNRPWYDYCSQIVDVNVLDGVTSIGNYAFYDCDNLTSVNIPASVTSIGEHAFSGCTNLTSINIPDSVTSIGYGVFNGCTNLTSVNIPDSVTSIGEHAFSGCTNLTSINIPASVTSIGNSAFSGCTNLTSIDIDNNVYISMDGVLFNKECTTLMCYPAGKSAEYAIPASVTSIGNGAFSGCTNLTSINIPDSVTSIGNSAFYGCTNLTSINIPDSVTSIGNYAFYDCDNLTSVNIPDSVTSIGGYVFNGSGLTSIDIPDSVTSIGDGAFSHCGLTSITIPASVTSIGNGAFSGCTNLTSAVFVDTSNWTVTKSSTIVTFTTQLLNASNAAYHLTNTYSSYTWTKS